MRWFIAQCLQAGQADRLDLPGLKPDRKPIIAGGLAILYTLAAQFNIDVLQPAKGALRQGVIIDLHQRLQARRKARHGDLRDLSVAELQGRFEVDVAQADRVTELAMSL